MAQSSGAAEPIRTARTARSKRLTVAVAGATGYAGQEMLRLIAGHPQFEITTVTAHASAGDKLGDHARNLGELGELTVQETTPEQLAGHDVVVLALPHGASGALAEQLADVPVVIDLGADHRLIRQEDWDDFYGGEFHEPWVYGLPELIVGAKLGVAYPRQRDKIKGATRIAGPGCNVTAVTLAAQPGLAAGLIEPHDIVATAVVGYSGAGKNLSRQNLLAAEAFGSAVPYAVGGVHRHIPEILQNFDIARGQEVARGLGITLAQGVAQGQDGAQAQDGAGEHTCSIDFTPVLAPMARGILASVSAPMSRRALDLSDDQIRDVWSEVYGEEHFITLLPPGVMPATADVIGSNAAHVQVVVNRHTRRILALSAIDNLNRGTAGQALQSLNIALGFPEETGLTTIGVAP